LFAIRSVETLLSRRWKTNKTTFPQRGSVTARTRVYRRALILTLITVLSLPSFPAAQGIPLFGEGTDGSSKQSTVLPSGLPFQFSADKKGVYDGKTNTFSIEGNVNISQGNTRLRADKIVYDLNTKEVTAKGKVIVRVGGDVVEAEEITVKLPQATGAMVDAKLHLARNNIYLEGKKLEKTGESSYRVEDGSFTTCSGVVPDWKIRGKEVNVSIGGYGTLKHGFFYVKDIPVFYMPWLIYPAKRQRQTGFLMPTLANSSLKGVDIRFPFFIDIAPSVDATIIPRICTYRAAQAGLEFRYFPYEELQGRFYGEYTYDWKYGTEGHPKNNRFYATWRHDQLLADILRVKANGSWVSDRDYFEFWGSRFDRRLRFRYLESNVVAYKQWNNFLFQAEARYFDNLDLPNNAVTVQNLPIVTASLFNQQIPYTPLYFSSNLVYDHYYAPIMNKQWLGSRAGLDARLSLPIALGRYLKLEPSMTYFPKAYAADYYEHDKSISSINTFRTDLYQVNADAFTDLYTVYGGGFLGFQRIKHNFRPRIGWTFRPFAPSQKYPYFDETDRLDRVSMLNAELRQTWTGRLGPGEYLDFMTLSLSQGYDLENARTIEDEAGRNVLLSPYGWTNTQAELIVKPHSLVDLAAQAEYDPVMNRARRYSVNLGFMDGRGDLFRVLHQFTEDNKREDLNRQTNVNVQLKLTSTLDFFFENQYTHQFDFSYFTSIGINYHPQCWNILLRYSEMREQDPVTKRIKEPDQTVFLTLSLYGLGQIYRFSRDWGEILGHAPEQSPAGAK
jgi:LPS-assembly protein